MCEWSETLHTSYESRAILTYIEHYSGRKKSVKNISEDHKLMPRIKYHISVTDNMHLHIIFIIQIVRFYAEILHENLYINCSLVLAGCRNGFESVSLS
jgi:hypothetical protein